MTARIVVSLDGSIVTEVELSKPATVLGRRPDCDVVIEHPAVSGRHALLRLVGTTVFVEDLASTNGVRVNGLACTRQVIRHLDLIEIGQHKIHFFDDSLLAGRVKDLEHTVSSDYERTSSMPGVLEAGGAVAVAPPKSVAPAASREPERDLDATQIFVARAPAKGDEPALRVMSGPRKGERISLDESHNLVGTTGGESALVVRRGTSFFLGRFSGHEAPRLNGRQIGPGTHAIAPGDTIEVGHTRYELILPDKP